MAKKENTFLLVSLDEEKAKKLANVIGSEACRKILDYLANRSATETQISNELVMPLSTVHYNVQQLLRAGLVKADEFHYSEKGREVEHYSIANKYIIIAPKTTEGLASKLKRILPVFAIVAATGIALQIFSGYGKTAQGFVAEKGAMAAQEAARIAPDGIPVAVAEGMRGAAQQPGTALWFAIGALFALVVYLIYDVMKEKRR